MLYDYLHKKKALREYRKAFVLCSFMDIWPLPHDFMYPEFCHHQNEIFIVMFPLFVLQIYEQKVNIKQTKGYFLSQIFVRM